MKKNTKKMCNLLPIQGLILHNKRRETEVRDLKSEIRKQEKVERWKVRVLSIDDLERMEKS